MTIQIDRTHGGGASHGTIDFSTSINPLGPPAAAIEEYHRVAASLRDYPSQYADSLAARIADWIGICADHVLVGNGSTQLIYLLARVMQWRRPFVVTPTFSEISNALALVEASPRAIELRLENDFELHIDEVTRALTAGADAILLGRPNSPTGSMISCELAIAIATECARFGAHCVFDEAFIDFSDQPQSMTSLVARAPKVIVLRSMTKIFGIPGLRLGFVVAEPESIVKLRSMLEPWSVNVVAERVGLVCLEVAGGYIARTRELIIREREYLIRGLAQNAHLRVFPSAANFLMFAVAEDRADQFGAFMLRRGIAVRDLRSLPGCGPGFYRVGIRNHADNERMVAAAREYKGAIRE
ncbi:MAG TPA: threonine-phosphate decarboxylase [Candidatus Binataceae bacterium]|jgi:threonine-phosphate decarboxylase|nr:threonine-phosphate decarboxylase [Candidatus Binataceae bacterium]